MEQRLIFPARYGIFAIESFQSYCCVFNGDISFRVAKGSNGPMDLRMKFGRVDRLGRLAAKVEVLGR